MNRLYLIIGGFVAFFLVLMYISAMDIEEIRRKRQEKKTKSLVEKIVTHANKKNTNPLIREQKRNPTGLKYGMDTSSDEIAAEPAPEIKVDSRGRTVGMSNPLVSKRTGREEGDDLNATMSPGSAPIDNNAAPQGANGTINSPARDDYYPPVVPGKTTGTSKKPTSSNQTNPDLPVGLFDPDMYGTRMNRVVEDETQKPRRRMVREGGAAEMPTKKESVFMAFEGTRAYLRSEDGEVIPAPDGYYEMPLSGRKILIRGGEKVMPN